MKLNKIKTPEKYIIDLNWTKKDLEESKKILLEWNDRNLTYYKNLPKYIKDVDLAEREHLKNAVNYYEEKFKNENQQT